MRMSRQFEEQSIEAIDPLETMPPAKKSMVIFFLVDTSKSMEGSKLESLNRVMGDILPELIGVGEAGTDVKVAVMSFSSGCEWITPEPVLIEEYQRWENLSADGVTDLGDACEELCQKLSRNSFLRAPSLSYAPVIFLMTDGYPTDNYKKGFEMLKKNLDKVTELIHNKQVLSTYALGFGGIGEAISKMAFGNRIGFKFNEGIEDLFKPNYGNIVLELASEDLSLLDGYNYIVLGSTTEEQSIIIENEEISLEELYNAHCETLEPIFQTKSVDIKEKIETINFISQGEAKKSSIAIAKPRVFIPTFPGTNCEYDLQRAFEKAGANTNIEVFKNLTYKDIEDSIETIVKQIRKSQIIMLPGGFSAGDEPDGSAKFMATVFRNPKVAEAVNEFLTKQDGLMLGICNGFQALIKLGLVPYGEIRETTVDAPTLTYNNIGRHQSKIVRTRIASNKSPWLKATEVGDTHSIAISHGEGKFVASEEVMRQLIANGQIATQYVDLDDNATYDIDFNPNGSTYAVEGITSADGRIFGKMGHSERVGEHVIKNIIGEKDQKIFESGVNYFK